MIFSPCGASRLPPLCTRSALGEEDDTVGARRRFLGVTELVCASVLRLGAKPVARLGWGEQL